MPDSIDPLGKNLRTVLQLEDYKKSRKIRRKELEKRYSQEIEQLKLKTIQIDMASSSHSFRATKLRVLYEYYEKALSCL